ALELDISLTACMDAGVGFLERLAQSGRGAFVRVLVVRMRNDADRQLAGQLAHGMAAHAVGHQKNVSLLAPLFYVTRQHHGERILIVASPHSHVGSAGVLNLVEASHAYPALALPFAYWSVSSLPASLSRGGALPRHSPRGYHGRRLCSEK